uniref:ORF17 n=1 Tax=Nitrosopumilaceae spindle-shaped virus TaxID=3065433 RepID=A0AAT9JFS7_9VIRU
MNYQTLLELELQQLEGLLESLRNPSLSYGDFQKTAELIKRGLDFAIADKKRETVQE